jgi:glycosyltransferase involved in cell wall biosynthesis
MRVLITSPSLDLSRNVSGMAAVTSFIAKHNTRCTYSHFVLGKADAAGRGLAWVGRTIAAYLKWIRLICAATCPLIHFNLALDFRGILRDCPLIIMARLRRRPVVVHVHGGEFLTGREMPAWCGSVVKKAFARGPVIVLSEVERATLTRIVPKTAIFVLPNCVDLPEAEPIEPRVRDGEGLTLLFMSRITQNKGIDVLFRALELARRRDNKIKLILAGTGAEEKEYVAKFEALLGGNFEFAGVVGGSDKAALMKRCNVFVLPSMFEGLPMALLESMASGLVPLTTAVGSIPTVVKNGHNGILVNRSSAEDLAAAIDALLADAHYLQTLQENARRCVMEMCNPNVYVSKLNAIYSYHDGAGFSRGY